jgi:transposase-like protein
MKKSVHSRRDTSKSAYWEKMIRGHEQSGQSIRAYCAEQKINEHLFYSWRRELNYRRMLDKKDKAPKTPSPFAPLSVRLNPPTSSPYPIEVETPGRYRLRIGTDEIEHLEKILTILEAKRC